MFPTSNILQVRDTICVMKYLIVDSCNDSCSYPHTNYVDIVEVLVQEKRQHQCVQEEQDSVEVAMPVRLSLILSEPYHQPVWHVSV